MKPLNWAADPRPRKPTVLGIGAQKAGTTWLNTMLGQHPGLWAPPFKETHFFDHLFKEESRRWTGQHLARAVNRLSERYEKNGVEMPEKLVAYLTRLTAEPTFDKDWYRHIFSPAPADTRPIDITPEYSGLPEEGVDFVRDFLPAQAQFIYIIRHPVDRIISQLKMNLMRQKRKPAHLDRWMAEIDNQVLYDRGNYAEYIPRWKARFGPDRLLILPFGRIAREPAALLAEIEDFLALPRHHYAGLHQKVFAAAAGISVPDPVRAEIRRRVEHQFDFLASEFDAAFNAQLR